MDLVILRPNFLSGGNKHLEFKTYPKPFIKHVVGKVVAIIFENRVYFESLELRTRNFPDDQFPY